MSSISSNCESSSCSSLDSSFDSQWDIDLKKQIVMTLKKFIKSKENEFAMDSYPNDNDDEFGIESEWSHVEKICSNVYLVSAMKEISGIYNEIMTGIDTDV